MDAVAPRSEAEASGTPPAAGAGAGDASAGSSATRSYVRGSGALLGGRFISTLLNLAVQVLVVRYLAKSDYGAFAYALGVASIGSSLVLVGLGKAVPRFVPIYHERGDHARAFGTVALAMGTVAGLGLSVVVLTFGLRGLVGGTVISDPLSLSLLLVLIALVPINALDHLLENLVAVFVSARAIFFRRYILGPSFKLIAILVVMLVAGDVYLLAYGYVLGGITGVWLYMSILVRRWREEGLLQHLHPRRLKLPAREVFRFSIPLLSSELPVLMRGSIALILLEYFRGTIAVAEYRAVYPVAGLNLIVFQAFGFLFVPLASRMFARAEREGISELYWQSSLWITVLTFPIFAVTCSLARPVAVLLFGAEYASAGTLLAVLAIGYYLNAALGYNAATLQVHGKVGYTAATDVVAAVTFLLLCVALIPEHGALGAAIATTASMMVNNVANHVGLRTCQTGIRLLDWRFVGVSAIAALLLLALLAVQWLAHPPVYVGFALAAMVSLALIRLTRHLVNPQDTFPELLRIPLVRQLLT